MHVPIFSPGLWTPSAQGSYFIHVSQPHWAWDLVLWKQFAKHKALPSWWFASSIFWIALPSLLVRVNATLSEQHSWSKKLGNSSSNEKACLVGRHVEPSCIFLLFSLEKVYFFKMTLSFCLSHTVNKYKSAFLMRHFLFYSFSDKGMNA